MKNFSGKGTITDDNGDVYDGAYRNNEPHGVGKMTYKDGRVCEGIWKEGKIEYEGELDENGKPHGRGKKIYSLGTYEGEWKDGLSDGKGTFMCMWHGGEFDGDVYKGQWKDNKMHGKGSYKWADGCSYEGEWKGSKKDGKGTYKRSDGKVKYDGEWKDEKWHGKGICNYENGDVYEGEWSIGKKQGGGVMTYANGDIYDGQWKNDHKDGQGTMKYRNGDVYEGGFSNDKMHGKGTFTYAAGYLLRSIGEWKEGKKCGEFENIVRSSEKVYYENDEVKVNPKVKREAPCDEDTDTEDDPPSKRRNVCVSPPRPQV